MYKRCVDGAFKDVCFQQPERAEENARRLGSQLPAEAREAAARLLAQLPDPDSALNNLERFASRGPAHVLDYLNARPAALYHVLALFSYSQYLADTLITDPELAIWVNEHPNLYQVKSAEQMLEQLGRFAAEPRQAGVVLSTVLARFKRREYLRIALRDVLRLATLAEVTLEISALADALLQYSLERGRAEMTERYGTPRIRATSERSSKPEEQDPNALVEPAPPAEMIDCPFAILSLGKLGGNELNYSSDVDLIFLYGANGETTRGISNKEYFVKLAHRVVEVLTAFGPEGSVFRVDLRLRPEGREGDMAVSFEAAREYYRNRARDWELQALIKARHSAGDSGLSRDFLQSVQPLIYSSSLDFSALDSVLFARERMTESLKRRGTRLGIDVKLERGGIRDIEFLAQCLQRLYGGQEAWLRSGGTLFALQKLADKRRVSQADFGTLSRAYVFLRQVEHLLQLENGQQTHRLPVATQALAVLARRARIAQPGGSGAPCSPAESQAAAEAFLAEVNKHMKAVRAIYDRLILKHPTEEAAPSFALEPERFIPGSGGGYHEVMRQVESACPALYGAIHELPVKRGQKDLQRFLLSAYANAEAFTLLCKQPALLERVWEIFEYSPYLSELLVRHPEEIAEIEDVPRDEPPASDHQGRIIADAPYVVEDDPVLAHIASSAETFTEKMAMMRRHYRRRLLRVQAHSMIGPVSVFSTLEAMTALAEQVLRAAYTVAVKEVARTMPRPDGDLIVVALGRLGIREFDVGSDADLGFLYAGGDPEAKAFWTRVAERLIEAISAYTGEGTIFSIDTRLRPRGREGELVEGEPNFVRYFQSAAEPWEALSYMKSRVVAGDIEEGTALLLRVQSRIGARFGRGPEAAGKLVDMRKRLESLAGPHNRLKTAPGGYYDIDFILTYLRLQQTDVFFKSLTTPERLRVVHEWMGQLRADQARTLHEGAVFLRGLEHALRISAGRSDAEIPPPGARSEPLQQLAARWLPESLRDKPLHEALDSVTSRVRAVFREVFG